MTKLSLTSLANLQNEQTAVAALNANSAATVTALENTLSRDGTSPNQMESDLDMNSNRIINLPLPAGSDEPVRKIDLENAQLSPTAQLSLPLSPGNGGTGLSSYSPGDLLYAVSSGTLAKLPAGATGKVLTQAAGPVPSWQVIPPVVLPFLNASNYAGASLSAKIATAILSSDAPATGCVIDARGITGAQNIDSSITGGSPKPVTILLGAGIFTMTVGVTLQSGQTLLGQGVGQTTLRLGASSGGMNGGLGPFNINGTDTEIGQFTLDNPSAFTAGTAAIFLNSTTRAYVHHCRIIQVLTGFCILGYNGTSYSRIENINLEPGSATIHGIGFNNLGPLDGHNKVYNCHVHGGAFGYNLILSNNNNFTNCSAYATGFASLEGFNIQTSQENLFVNISAQGRGDNGFVEFQTSFHNHIVGGSFFGNRLGGIYTTATDSVYEDCFCYNNNQLTASLSSGMIVASDVSFGTASGITVNNLTCFDSQGSPTQKYGIQIYAGVNNTFVTGARFRGNVSGDILDSGTGSILQYMSNSGVYVFKDVRAVASLPAAASASGGRCLVADATVSTFGSIVAGGGGIAVPVYSDGTNWRIG